MAELLSIPLKKSSDVDIVKPLRNLIQATYSGAEAVDDCNEAVEELARLRAQAIWKVFDKSSLDVIYNYYDQLVSLESKVPPQEVAVPFKWKDAFDRGSIFSGRMSLTVSSLAFERVCVAFNMAALQSALAAQQPLDSEDSLKLAAKLCQQAAGLLAWLKGAALAAVQLEPTPDLQPDTLAALQLVMLAQAQELIAYKCIRDGMKEGTVAKVCAAGEEMYGEAARAVQREAARALAEREWAAALLAKQHALRGLAQLYQAQACGAAARYGEAVARLRLAADALRAAAGGGGGGGGGRLAGVRPLAEAAARAGRLLADAERDNDFIYHDRVPDAAQLEPVPRAPVAKPLPPPDRWGTHRDLFARLVPLRVAGALQAAAARRADAVAAEVARLRDNTQLLNSILSSLSLPACVEAGGAGGALPASLSARAGAVRAAGGLPRLRALLAELPDLLQRNRDILTEAERMLREEEEADAALRAQFGARWTRTESAKLTEAFRANAAKYDQIIDNAVAADDIVQKKFQQHKENIALLSGGEEELSAGVPAGCGREAAAGAGAAGEEAAAEALRRLLADVEELKAGRDRLEAELQAVRVELRPAFEAALAETGAVDEAALSGAPLAEALRPLRQRVLDDTRRQEALVAELQRAHSALMSARGGGGGGRAAREAALGALAAAADAFQDLTANLQEGVKFYNDLTQLLVAFQNKVSDYCFARRTEKEELLKDLTQQASRSSAPPPPPAPGPQRPADEPATTRREAPPRPAPPAPSPAAAAAAAAALPYPAQPQGMPLPYGASAGAGAGGYGYFAAPLPVGYNPYATLPYPHHARLPAAPQPYLPYQHPPAQPYPPPPAPGYSPYGPPPQ